MKKVTTKASAAAAPAAVESTARQQIEKIVRSLVDAPQRTESRIVLLTWEAVQEIAKVCGITIERNQHGKITEITIRGNRPEQVTTKKLKQSICKPFSLMAFTWRSLASRVTSLPALANIPPKKQPTAPAPITATLLIFVTMAGNRLIKVKIIIGGLPFNFLRPKQNHPKVVCCD